MEQGSSTVTENLASVVLGPLQERSIAAACYPGKSSQPRELRLRV